MITRQLYKQDVYMKAAQGIVTGVEATDEGCVITLDQTVFFPEGGGQSSDKGTINGFPVLHVYEKNNEIFHLVDCPKDGIAVGKEADLLIDWGHRFDNMQRHCGEHILSGIFHREFGGVNRGFHMGEQYMTIDISLEDDSAYDKITWEMAQKAELEANKVVWQNLPVITRHFETKKEAENLPLRKALALESDITIVCVGAVENPSDCVACCGTHPSTAGQVGLIKIYKVESNKGMFRIYFEAGQRALERYRKEYETLTGLGNILSAGTEDLMNKFHAQQEKNKEIRTHLYLLKKEVLHRQVSEITTLLQSSNTNVIRHYNILTPDDISSIARDISSEIKKIAFLVHNPSKTVFLCSNGNVDCGKLVKDNVSIYNGKGGGNKTLARAIFSKDEYIPVFIDLIEKHLR